MKNQISFFQYVVDKYCEKFGENAPLQLFRGMTDEEIIKILQDCIDKDRVYSVDNDNIY